MSTPTSSILFISTANAHLSRLSDEHIASLQAADHHRLQLTLKHARVVRRAAIVHRASHDILALPNHSSDYIAQFLRALLPRLEHALNDTNYDQLDLLADSAQQVLDSTVVGNNTVFQPIQPPTGRSGNNIDNIAADTNTRHSPPLSHQHLPNFEADNHLDEASASAVLRPVTVTSNTKSITIPTTNPTKVLRERRRPLSIFGVSFTSFSMRDKLILILYLLMVVAAIIAITIITVDFAREAINPSGFISSDIFPNLTAPVVTVCLSQAGVPLSRLQLFNYTDAAGTNFVGADPQGPQDSRASPEFTAVVDRFWENPLNEDCNSKVGDFFPFPINSLNRLANGTMSTSCRQCYRVGAKHQPVANSSAFQNSSILSFYTDNYFLQCLKSVDGLNTPSLTFLHQLLFKFRADMSRLEVLSADLDPVQSISSVTDLKLQHFEIVTSEQACNIFYFAYFPKQLNRMDPDVDIRYNFDGENWVEVGTGPYFRIRKEALKGFFPTESLQMFVESPERNETNRALGEESDMILIGPSTQTFASFRRLNVFGTERYEISSSTSNLRQSDITPLFGYWLIYSIYFNYNRFVVDTYYRQSTYPAGQWFVDLTGYASLFTGASIFSLLLLPLLRTMRKREKTLLLQQVPEGYVWSKHRRHLAHGGNAAVELARDRTQGSSNDSFLKMNSVLLPGYNV